MMTTQEISDLVFGPFQEDAAESIEPPWAVGNANDDTWGATFKTDRIGNALHITEWATGQQFVVTVEERP